MKGNNIRPLLSKTAGWVTIFRYNAYGRPDYNDYYTTTNDILQTIQVTDTNTTTSIINGNGSDITMNTGSSTTAVVTFSTYDPLMHGFLDGSRITQNVDNEMMSTEEGTIEATGTPPTFTYQLKHKLKKYGNNVRLNIYDRNNNAFDIVPDSQLLSGGEIHVDIDTGEIEFSALDNGKKFNVTYFYEASNATTIEKRPIPKTQSFLFISVSEYTDTDGSAVYTGQIEITKCTISGDIVPPPQGKDPSAGWSITFVTSDTPINEPPVKKKFTATSLGVQHNINVTVIGGTADTTVEPSTATEGEEVIVTVKNIEAGKLVKEAKALTTSGIIVPMVEDLTVPVGEKKYTFKMPNYEINLSITLEEEPNPAP